MYTGTMIDDLLKAVQKAEMHSKSVERKKQIGMLELQLFMQQMQHSQNVSRIRIGAA